jgi:hypothetical protein
MLSTPFDILKRQKDGSYIWVEAVRDLQKAKARMQQLCATVPGEYFVFDQKVQKVVAEVAGEMLVPEL